VKYLVDTNIISELRKRERAHPNVLRWLSRTAAEEIATSVLVLGEIRRGIEMKRRRDPEQAKSLDRWFSQMRTGLGARVLPVDEAVAEAWAMIGIPNPVPLIDGLLAATAKVHGLTFVTRNVTDVPVAGVALLDPFSTAE
jgi:predicted nucleic acid-binding protein